MSEILNLEAIEQQRILITVSLTGSDGAPVNPSDYVICAAAIGQPNPYTQRAVRKEWAASINNENSAFLLTCPGLDMAAAPWKYRILLKNRALELEWQVVSGRISLTPRACGTDGISPASYSVACEATPSGLVNVTLDATVGSISETLEQVKASAAAAAAAAQNAHDDLEDAETAATKASQAALAAAADAKTASDKATAAEAAATAAPEACAPYVTQVQQAAAAALDASRAATTAAAEAQASADAAAPAQGYATHAEQAKTAAVQAAGEATTAATTATQQAESATAQAESARLAATTATQQAEAAAASATQADVDARACGIYDQRVSANATRAEAAQQAAAASETAAAASATNAAASATAAASSAQEFFDAELKRMVDLASITYGLLELSGVTDGAYLSEINRDTGVPRIYVVASGSKKKADIVVSNSASYDPTEGKGWARVLYLPKVTLMKAWDCPFAENKTNYLHAPALNSRSGYLVAYNSYGTMILSPETKFEFLESCDSMFRGFSGSIVWAPGTAFGKLKKAGYLFAGTRMTTLPDTFTFSSLQYGYCMFQACMLTNLPAAMELPSLTEGSAMFHGCSQMEIEDIVRVCLTINDLQALATPKTGSLGLPASCKHNGETVNTQAWLNANHPDFLVTLNARGWTVTFA